MGKTYVIISGYFNPIHPGHIDYMELSKGLGDELWVIVNNDIQAELKRGVPSFQDNTFRMRVVGAMKSVDQVILCEDTARRENGEIPVVNTLEKVILQIRQKEENSKIIFANGGDRNKNIDNIPEVDICRKYNVELKDGLGEKTHHSREYISIGG